MKIEMELSPAEVALTLEVLDHYRGRIEAETANLTLASSIQDVIQKLIEAVGRAL